MTPRAFYSHHPTLRIGHTHLDFSPVPRLFDPTDIYDFPWIPQDAWFVCTHQLPTHRHSPRLLPTLSASSPSATLGLIPPNSQLIGYSPSQAGLGLRYLLSIIPSPS